jgi:cytidylate kinase
MIIAIDGPSGAGKSTLGKMLAKKLGLLYLDTGAMYRAVAHAVLLTGSDPEDAGKATRIAAESAIELRGEPDNLQVFLNGANVSEAIRTNEAGQAASKVSTLSEVRKILVKRQQELGARGPGCVLDGRDIGTVVFPNADVKFYLTANPESRARRRFEEDRAKGAAVTYEHTLAEINSRDKRDVTRADSPLSVAADAIVLDTSELDLQQALAEMMRQIETRRKHER